MKIQVLGKGCSKCDATAKLIQETAIKLGVQVELEKVHDIQKIVAMGIMSTPAVAIEGKVVSSGKIPPVEQVTVWLTAKD